jgi:hypothetical protein
MLSIGSYSCVLFKKQKTYVDCGSFCIMYLKQSWYLCFKASGLSNVGTFTCRVFKLINPTVRVFVHSDMYFLFYVPKTYKLTNILYIYFKFMHFRVSKFIFNHHAQVSLLYILYTEKFAVILSGARGKFIKQLFYTIIVLTDNRPIRPKRIEGREFYINM